jgi:hypothetical protein
MCYANLLANEKTQLSLYIYPVIDAITKVTAGTRFIIAVAIDDDAK